MIRTALPALLIVLCVAAGCDRRSAAAKKEGSEASQAVEFRNLWPQEETAKLTPEQRADLREQALVALKGNNWQHAQDVLVALGADAVPALIDLVGSKERSAASAGPVPSAKVKTMGELANDTLLLIVQNRSSYRGEMPARNQDAWRRWWADNATRVASKS